MTENNSPKVKILESASSSHDSNDASGRKENKSASKQSKTSRDTHLNQISPLKSSENLQTELVNTKKDNKTPIKNPDNKSNEDNIVYQHTPKLNANINNLGSNSQELTVANTSHAHTRIITESVSQPSLTKSTEKDATLIVSQLLKDLVAKILKENVGFKKSDSFKLDGPLMQNNANILDDLITDPIDVDMTEGSSVDVEYCPKPNTDVKKYNISKLKRFSPLESEDSSDSDVNKRSDEIIIVTSYDQNSSMLPDLISGSRKSSNYDARIPPQNYPTSYNNQSNANFHINSSHCSNREEKKYTLADELKRDDLSIIHIKPGSSNTVVPPLGAIMRNPLKEGVRIALPRQEKHLQDNKTSYQCPQFTMTCDEDNSMGESTVSEDLPQEFNVPTARDAYWLMKVSTEHDKRIPCFTRPVNWIRVDVDMRYYNMHNEEINARLFTLLNYPLFLPQIRLQPLAWRSPSNQFTNFAMMPPVRVPNMQTGFHGGAQAGLPRYIPNPGAATSTRYNPERRRSVNVGDLVPRRDRYKRVWAEMPPAFVIQSSVHTYDNFSMALYILPDPALASMSHDSGTRLSEFKGWRMVVIVIPPSKLGIQNICHQEYFIPAPTKLGAKKRVHDDYIVQELHGTEAFPFQVLWEIKNRKKHYVSWSAVIEFSQTIDEMNSEEDITAHLLVSSVPFHFGGESNGSGMRHIIGHPFLPKAAFCNNLEFHEQPRFTNLHEITLPRPAASATRFQLPVCLHVFCLPELTSDKEYIINNTPFNEYCRQMIKFANGMRTRRPVQQPRMEISDPPPYVCPPARPYACPPTRPYACPPARDYSYPPAHDYAYPPAHDYAYPPAQHTQNTMHLPPPYPINMGFAHQPMPYYQIAPRYGPVPHWPSQVFQPTSGLRHLQEDDFIANNLPLQ